MTSTHTLSKTISSRMRFPIVSALKPKNPWPDSQGSIGSLLCPMGRNKCWEAVGPAGELSKGNLFKEIKKLLESQHEYLNEGESVPRAILFEVYMIGRNETFARPTILFCCERKPPRQRAMKLVRESLVLVEYPGVQLGDCSRPPNLTHQPVPLFDPISEEDDRVLVGSSPSGIIYRPPIKSLFGLPVYVQLSHDHLRAATIGGFICLGDTIVGLSVRHVFDEDQDELNPEDFGTVMEFSLEYDDFEEDVEGEGNIDSVMMTSTGSISPSRVDSDDSEPSIQTEVLITTDNEENLASENGASKLMKPSQVNEGRETLGYPLIISVPTESENADWAICGLSPPFGFDSESHKCINGQLGAIKVTSIVETPHSKAAVLTITGSNGAIRGTISGNISFVQLAGSTAFQEMWTVRLEGPLLPGDCGSWVIDADSGVLYGHIVAGDPGASVAYVTPAKQIFREVENRTGRTVTFPSSESVMKYLASHTDTGATKLDEEMVGYTPIATSSSLASYEQSTYDVEINLETSNEDIKKVKSEPLNQYKFEDLLESFMPAGVKVEDTDSDVSNIVQLPPRNTFFVDRENELTEIHQVLCIQAICCLTGAAAVGKTEIALEYAHRHKDAYSDIFWVTDPSVMLQETFGKMCDDEQFADVDESPGQGRRKKWLAILDNVEGGLEIKFLLHQWNLEQGSILITTRQREFAIPSGILWYRKEIYSLSTTPFYQFKSQETSIGSERESDSSRGTNFAQNDQRSPKRPKKEQTMAMTRSYTQSPSSEVVQDVMNSTTFNPISLISNFLDSYVQEHQVTSMAPRSQTENTEKAHSKATGKKPQGRKRTKTGCLTCRKRRIKCGEERPICNNCTKSKRQCEGYNQRVVFKDPLNEYPPYALDHHLHPHSGQKEPTLVQWAAKPPTPESDLIGLPIPQPKPTDEIYDDDQWDVSDEDTVFDLNFEPSSDSYEHLEKNDIGIVVALQARREEAPSFTSFLDRSGILDTYIPSPSSSPLKDSITAQIFCHFVNAVAATLSMYERNPANSSLVFQAHPIPKSQQHIWTYTMPTLALMNPGLLHSILAVGSLHIGLMQNGPLTASLKHYAIALRRVAKAVSLQHRRQAPETLAACLLLGWYELMCANHQRWSNHLQGIRMLLQEVDFAKIERYKKRVRGSQLSPLHWSASSPGNAQVAVFGELDENLIQMLLGEKPEVNDPSTSAINDNEKYTQRDLELHEIQRDMFWWFCKQDIVQSILGGTGLTLPYKSWGGCPPRAPIGRITAVYGTNDHLILLLGRIADFTSRDLKRKQLSIRKYGATKPPQHLEENYSTIEADTMQAEEEWHEIRNAFFILEKSFGDDFNAIGPDFTDPISTPFGPATVYRTYGMTGIWLNFYMGLIIAYRAHPSMPPATLMAADIAARQTSSFANEVGRIVAGICPSISRSTEVNPQTSAALIESSVALFVAGVQYQDAAQRLWVIQRFSDIARLTGFKYAIAFAKGCEASWIKNAEMGLGPLYRRPTDNRHSDNPLLDLERVFDTSPANDVNKSVLSRAHRVHYALGILGVNEDLEKLDLSQLE